jgi:hypothetical protein
MSASFVGSSMSLQSDRRQTADFHKMGCGIAAMNSSAGSGLHPLWAASFVGSSMSLQKYRRQTAEAEMVLSHRHGAAEYDL